MTRKFGVWVPVTLLVVWGFASTGGRLASQENKTTANGGLTTFDYECDGQSCADDMSGELFESKVRITLDGRPHPGCGLALH